MNLRKIVIGGLLATTAIGGSIALASSANAAGAPVTTTTTAAVDVMGTQVDLPALNGQFTSMTLKVNDSAHSSFGPNADMETWYANGIFQGNDGVDATGNGGFWIGDHGYGTMLAPNVHAGAVVYSVDNGVTWNKVVTGATITNDPSTHVILAYNDIPGLYGDNTGPGYTVTMVRTKA